jgi:hypothetical protein
VSLSKVFTDSCDHRADPSVVPSTIGENRIYLMGHSMGGAGAIYLREARVHLGGHWR